MSSFLTAAKTIERIAIKDRTHEGLLLKGTWLLLEAVEQLAVH